MKVTFVLSAFGQKKRESGHMHLGTSEDFENLIL